MLIMIKQKQSGLYIYERDFKDVHTTKESLNNIFVARTNKDAIECTSSPMSVIMCDCQDRGMNDNCVSQSPDIILILHNFNISCIYRSYYFSVFVMF